MSLSTLVAAGTALVTVRQGSGEQRLTRDGQVTDRYTAAVANLGDKAEEVRIGGLYALQRIAQDSPRDAPTIVQVVSAYVRSHAPLPNKGTKGPDHPTNDVAAALSILAQPLTKNTSVDLNHTNLTGAYLDHAYLAGANLAGAKLTDVTLSGANLNEADLTETDLIRGYLPTADLEYADLAGANLTDGDLRLAKLGSANLSGVNLSRAKLAGAHLEYADLEYANLEYANLEYANLQTAHLDKANLNHVKPAKEYLGGFYGDPTF